VKWALLVIGAALVWPLSMRLRRNPHEKLKAFALAGFLPFILRIGHLYIAIDSWDWVGYVKGAELSILDLLALAIYLSLPRSYGRLPFRFSMAAYFIATVLSATEARFPMTALFYSWQLARMFLLYATLYRGICADPRVASAVLKGMGAGILMQAAVAILERFGFGVLQAHGTFVGQNELGMISLLVALPFFAVLLGGRRGWLPPAVVVAGLIVEVLTTSRGAIALAGFGFAAILLLSALRRWTSRKGLILLAGVAAMAVFAPLAEASFQERFKGTDFSFGEDSERIAYKKAAAEMLSDHPLGVGANNFTFVANVEGYFLRAGEATYFSGLAGNVHNIYWLVASETGYFGLMTFTILLLSPLTVAFVSSIRRAREARGDLLMGLGVALVVVYLHSFEEWVFITFDVQYIFSMEIGLIAGLATELARNGRTAGCVSRPQLRDGPSPRFDAC
jgi:O-antigen ligase